MLIDWSRDARPESGDMIGVMTSTGIGKYIWSQDIQLESYLLIGVGHTTRVASSNQSWAYDRSQAYDRSWDIPAL
jgi:hypothetical protein